MVWWFLLFSLASILSWKVTADGSCVGSISQLEFTALEMFFNATGGPQWRWDRLQPDITHWSFPSPLSYPCEHHWQGLNCSTSLADPHECTVIGISLPLYGLKNQIPESVSDFPNLLSLVLPTNELKGHIPASIWSMTTLQSLDLSRNEHTGTIPTLIGQLTNLNSFELTANIMRGSLPTEIGLISCLNVIDISLNIFTGTLPTELGRLSNLYMVIVYNNHFTGTLPSELGSLSVVISLGMNFNSFSGSIPTEFGRMTALEQLGLNNNYLTGFLPTQIVQTQMANLFLYENFLSGQLPEKWCHLTQLIQFGLQNNAIEGTIPTCFGNLTGVRLLDVSSNLLAGTLPSELSAIVNATELLLSINYFVGTLPVEWFSFPNLIQLAVDENHLTGTIPSEINGLTVMTQLSFQSNSFSGTIPTELFQLTNLHSIYLYDNCITGTIPTEIGLVRNVLLLYLDSTLLTGTIPVELGNLYHLQVIELFGSFFTGTLDALNGNMTFIQFLQVGNNYLTGTLPTVINSNKYVKAIITNNNFLTGTLPISWENLHLLQMVDVSANLLTGNLVKQFENRSNFIHMIYLDVSMNSFTGPLPDSLFAESRFELETLNLFGNCFSGSLPTAICDSKSLTTLVLDSLSSAPSCDVTLRGGVSFIKGVFAKKALTGGVPACVWDMPRLSTLHLSGNGLSGTLVDLPSISRLTDVALANNDFTGSIPPSWQLRGNFTTINLSCNKLSGTLMSDFQISSSNTQIDLTVNRLSGPIPEAFMSAVGTDILDGNLFQCQSSDMPTYDPNSDQYICGSSELNDSLLVWGVIVVALLLAWAVYVNRRVGVVLGEYRSFMCDLLSDVVSSGCDLTNTIDMLYLVRSFCRCCMALALGYVIIAMSAYGILKTEGGSRNSTHTYQYSWRPTAAFMHGQVAVGIICTFVILSGVAVAMLMAEVLGRSRLSLHRGNSDTVPTRFSLFELSISTRAGRTLATVALITGHVVVIVAVNVFYIYLLVIGLPSLELLSLQFSLSVFKLGWDSIFIVGCMARLDFLSERHRLLLSATLTTFTFLMGPLLATFFSDDTCFRYVLTGSPDVTSSFLTKYFECDILCGADECINLCAMSRQSVNTVVTVAKPIWLYSFQCSSMLLVNYIPVLIFSYLISGVIRPAITMFYSNLSHTVIETYVPETVRDSVLSSGLYIYKAPLGDSVSQKVPPMVQSTVTSPLSSSDTPDDRSNVVVTSKRVGGPLLNSAHLLARCTLNLVIMITFGLASPVLAVLIAVDCAAGVANLQVLIRRYIRLHEPQHQQAETGAGEQVNTNSVGNATQEACRQLEQATNNAAAGLSACLQLVMVSAGLFWSIFVFDMAGDLYGVLTGGLLILVPTVGLWVVYNMSVWVIARCVRATPRGESLLGAGSGMGIQLSTDLRTESVSRLHPDTNLNQKF